MAIHKAKKLSRLAAHSSSKRRDLLTCGILLVSLAAMVVVGLAVPLESDQFADADGDIQANGDFSAPYYYGTWNIAHPAKHHEIEGYASVDSVLPGSTEGLDVSCINPAKFKTDIFRMGYYGGAGALLTSQIGYTSCSKQNAPTFNPTNGLYDTQWTQTQHLIIPKTWQPGYYLARLTSTSGYQSYIPFLVRSPKVTSKYLFVDAIATSEAYNDWGGNSLYVGYTPAARVTRGFKVSLNRPDNLNYGAGEFLDWEYPMVR